MSPEGCSSLLFPRIMGITKANEVLLQGKKLSTAEALDCGFISEVFDGVDFVTVHGNDAILAAAGSVPRDRLKVLAVTVLTSLDAGDLRDLGFECDVEALVLSRARRALAHGCDGVVSSGLEAGRLRSELGQRLLIVCPGIRPVENRPVDDQKRVVTVRQAFAAGADYIVVGRPIREAPDPRAAAEAIQERIAESLRG